MAATNSVQLKVEVDTGELEAWIERIEKSDLYERVEELEDKCAASFRDLVAVNQSLCAEVEQTTDDRQTEYADLAQQLRQRERSIVKLSRRLNAVEQTTRRIGDTLNREEINRYSGVNGHIRKHEDVLADLKARVAMIENVNGEIANDDEAIRATMDRLGERLEKVEDHLNTFGEWLETPQEQVEAEKIEQMERTSAEVLYGTNIATLAHRLDKVERAVAEALNRAQGAESLYTSVRQRISDEAGVSFNRDAKAFEAINNAEKRLADIEQTLNQPAPTVELHDEGRLSDADIERIAQKVYETAQHDAQSMPLMFIRRFAC